jgi:hypothetical protein
MHALFIGGPWDGEVHDVEPPPVAFRFDDGPDIDPLRVGIYERQKFQMLGWVLPIYVLSGMGEGERDRAMTEAIVRPELLELGTWRERNAVYG